METHKDVLINKYKSFTRHEAVVLDNSSISEYKKCPKSYFFRYVLGLTPREIPAYFPFGTAYHKFREVLEVEHAKLVAEGRSKVEYMGLPVLSAMQEMEACYKKEIRNGVIQDNKKFDHLNLERLKTSIQVAAKWWVGEKEAGNIKVLASEQIISIELEPDVYIGGRLDQLINWRGKLYIRDFKTSAKPAYQYFQNINPNSQFAQYTYMGSELHGKQIYGVLVEGLFNLKTKPPEIQMQQVGFTREQLAMWKEDVLSWISKINTAREKDHYEMNESSCWSCAFKKVCEMPGENSQSSVLRSQFKKHLWDYSKAGD